MSSMEEILGTEAEQEAAASHVKWMTQLVQALPLTIIEYTTVGAFCNPNSDVMDSIVHQSVRMRQDLDLVRQQIEKAAQDAGSPSQKWCIEQISQGAKSGELSREDYGRVLRRLGVSVSKERLTRLFEFCDVNDNGTVSAAEFSKAVFGNK